jgi:dipeptidase E
LLQYILYLQNAKNYVITKRRWLMKLLLTSAGISNKSINDALVELLGKPIAESNALCIPTGIYAIPGGVGHAWQFLSGQAETPMCELGWKSMGVLELTALPSIDKELWLPVVNEADVILVNGGDPLYLYYWMRQSGLADLLPTLPAVYVGLSAGSMVMAPNIGDFFVGWTLPEGGDKTLGLVDFAIFPHLDHEMLPYNTIAAAKKWAAGMQGPTYAIDDQTAIKVTDGKIEVISEGHWKQFTHE